jgi:signal transduction histidine kinase
LWWQAAFVFGPLIVLALLGLWGIRESRAAAKRNAVRAVELVVPTLEQIVRNEEARLRDATTPMDVFRTTVLIPAEQGEALRLYEKALGSPDEADALFDQIERGHENATSASGVPLLPLVKWARLQRASDDRSAKLAESLAVAAVRTHPSVLSPTLLEKSAALLRDRGLDDATLVRWHRVFAEHEQARAIWNSNPHGSYVAKKDEWLPEANPQWYFKVAGNGLMRPYSPAAIRASAVRIAKDTAARLPEFFAVDVSINAGGKDSLLGRAPAGERFFERGSEVFSIACVLVDPAGLYAQQRQQTLWLGGLLVVAVLSAGAGFFTLRRSLARERRLGEMKSNFVSSVSHELRTPVASMQLMAENLDTGVVTDEARKKEYHRLIADECRRLGSLIENVLDFARIEQGRKSYRFSETNVAELLRETVRLMQPRAATRKQRIVVEAEEILPECDGLAIQQALVNLLENAVKFSPEGKTITAIVRRVDDATWEISVSDEGPGVAQAEREKIFERFYRAGSELTRETQGTGIGLSIVMHVAEAHGGTVTVGDAAGGGAQFTLRLPYLQKS